MCLFPLPNGNVRGEAFKKGVTAFACGGCPECMTSRSNKIMLRDVFEASTHKYNCMCTLTYDTYIRDSQGRIVGEKLNLRKVDVRDCQLFIKRLRDYVSRNYGATFKYRLSAEYGKKTHRPHYHVLFFGWTFPDCLPYKKSKRGNWIYTSAILSRLWSHGICTVDSKRVTPSIARYCSKYSAKNYGVEDTFSLCSHGIGIEPLYKAFNGLYYVVEGQRFSIPREVWQRYISDCYAGKFHFDTRYINKTEETISNGSYMRSRRLRKAYRIIRDHDPSYQAYLEYWSKQADTFKLLQPSVFQRILALDENKFHFYKSSALKVLSRRSKGVPAVAPRSKCISAYERYLQRVGIPSVREMKERESHLPFSSRLNRANDRQYYEIFKRKNATVKILAVDDLNPFDFPDFYK